MAPKATGNQNRLDSNRKVVGSSPARPSGEPQARLVKGEPRAGPPGPPVPHAGLQTRLQARGGRVRPGRAGGAEERQSFSTSPGLPSPLPRSGAPVPSHPGRARRAPPKFPKTRKVAGSRADGRLPRAASAGSSARQSRGAKSGGMPARRLPAAPGGGLCAGPTELRRTRARRTVPRAAAARYCPLPPGWRAALGSRGLPGPAPRPGSFLHCARARARTRAPRPCAPSRGRGTSEALGCRALRPRPPAPPPGPRPRRSLRTPRPLAGRAPRRAPTSPRLLGLGRAAGALVFPAWGPRRCRGGSAAGARDYFSLESFQRPKVWSEAAEGSCSGCCRSRQL